MGDRERRPRRESTPSDGDSPFIASSRLTGSPIARKTTMDPSTSLTEFSRTTSSSTITPPDMGSLISQQLDKIIEETAYQGFNPISLRKTLKARELDIERFCSDIAFLIVIYITKGTNLTKVAAKSSEAQAAKIRKLKATYHIEDPGSKLKNNTTTMARIGACFPEEVMKCIRAMETYVGAAGDFEADFPDVLRTPVAASVFPKKEGSVTSALLDVHFRYLQALDPVINANRPTPYDKLKLNQKAAFNSPLHSEKMRIKICEELGLIEFGPDKGIVGIGAIKKQVNYINERKYRGRRSEDYGEDDEQTTRPFKRSKK